MSSFFTAAEFHELCDEIQRTASWTINKADAHGVILDVLRAVADKLRTMEPIYYDDARTEDELELLKTYADLIDPDKQEQP